MSDDPSAGLELWSSDGTDGGTGMVRDAYPGTGDSGVYFLRQLGDKLIFRADDGVHGNEPMALDAEGNLTVLGDLEPGSKSSFATGTAVAGNKLIMPVTTSAKGDEVWATDGTAAGTVMLKDISYLLGSFPHDFIEYDGKVFFAATDEAHGTDMWVTDGTAAGTVLFKDVAPSNRTGFAKPVVMNGLLYFFARDAQGALDLWRSDGTVAGTVRVTDVYSDNRAYPVQVTSCNGVIYFSGADGTGGTDLWRSDGTAAGTRILKKLYMSSPSGGPVAMAAAGAYLYFAAADGAGSTAWRTDGTDAGTIRLSTTALSPVGFTAFDDAAYFFALNTAGVWELWRSDGSATGTSVVAPVSPAPTAMYTPRSPGSLSVANGRLFFVADGAWSGRELWSSDGTTLGTRMVQDLTPGVSDGFRGTQIATLDGAVYVQGDDSVSGAEPWRFADRYAPVVWGQGLDLTGAEPTFAVTFNEAIKAPLVSDIVLTNETTGELVPTDRLNIAYDASTHTVRLTFPGYAGATSPDGNYHLSLRSGSVVDVAGNVVQSPIGFDFFFLRGDANHDRAVDFNDLVKLAQNYNTSGKSFGEGDFNFDGNVDFNDLVILAQRYNTSLPVSGGLATGAGISPGILAALMPATSSPATVADDVLRKKAKTPLEKVFRAPVAKPVAATKVARSPFAHTRVR